MVDFQRTSGVQLHPTSLPGGRLGAEAFGFVDWLAAAGQSWWQTLPLGPPDRSRSPYKARSAFAASPGLLAEPRAAVSLDEEDRFRAANAYWIGDWERFAGGRRAVLDQVRFAREWSSLRRYARERGVGVIGDLPIYVAPGGADHRAHPELFQAGAVAGAPPDRFTARGQLWGNPLYDWPALRRRGYRWWTQRFARTFDLFDLARIDHFRGFVSYWSVPAGAPDASFGRWRRGPGRAPFLAAQRVFGARLGARLPLIAEDLGVITEPVRRLPLIAEDLGVITEPVRRLPLIAEDLGVITEPVRRLREELGLPGMVVLQFGFDELDPHGPHRPENHRERSVVYTGTHDHDTIVGWFGRLGDRERTAVIAACEARGIHERRPEWALIRLAFSSPARLAMVQAQDVLGLGSEARMNVPGRATGNWRWQMERGALTARLARRLRSAAEEAGRGVG